MPARSGKDVTVIERLVPKPFKNSYRQLRSSIKNRAFGSTKEQIFDEIYRQQCWGSSPDGKLYSGSGTYDPSVDQYLQYVTGFIEQHGIRSIVEIGCGDFAIGRQYAARVDSYLGIDASSIVVRSNQEQFATDKISFRHADAASTDLAPADLCIIRQVLQHLDNKSIAAILRKVALHKYTLITEHLPSAEFLVSPNMDKRSGPDIRIAFNSGVYLEQPPFNRHGEVVLTTPIAQPIRHPGEVLRTTLLSRI